MKRFDLSTSLGTVPIFRFEKWDCPLHSLRRGYTLIEILVATTLTLMMMAAVAVIFGMVGRSVNDSRATLEMADALRSTAMRLQADLEGVTAATVPPRDPAANEGYFEYIEGPVGPMTAVPSTNFAVDADSGNTADTTPIDNDDILMFTTRSEQEPFVGRFGAGTIESQVAEVAWFVRGRTLYRRLLLVVPGATVPGPAGFYANYDLSVRNVGGALVPNTLGDLTPRENRFAHQSPKSGDSNSHFPFHPHLRLDSSGAALVADWAKLGLPTLRECSKDGTTDPTTTVWSAGGPLPVIALTSSGSFDAWTNPYPWTVSGQPLNPATGALPDYLGIRVAEDVILNNVIGFDVKAWDPGAPVLRLTSGVVVVPGDPGYAAALTSYLAGGAGAPTLVSSGAYVDLAYYTAAAVSAFSGQPNAKSGLQGLTGTPSFLPTYDTWSTHYESDGIDENNNGVIDEGTNGFDDNGDGVIDDEGERETSPPYPVPLRGIQVKIRVFEPDSRQIREVTIIQDFLKR